MDNELILLSNNDIPFKEGQVNIHQPTIKEISLIGEESFHIGSRFLNFSVDDLSIKDKSILENKTDFEVFMSVINNRSMKQRYKIDAVLVLTLLFPEYQILFESDKIRLLNGEQEHSINKDNFSSFKDILSSMFCLEKKESKTSYNPADAFAEKIAAKFKKREEILSEKKDNGEIKKIAIFSKMISILTIGNQLDINTLMNYTVFQLKDAFDRFQRKQNFDIYVKAKMAGAKDIEEVENWMDDIHPK